MQWSNIMWQKPQDLQEILTQDYRYLHQHPELSFQETETTAWLIAQLGALGIEVLDTGLSTGLVAIIRGDQAGKSVALRADIDALPVREETALPYASVAQGVIHASGHDFHTSALPGAARQLQ